MAAHETLQPGTAPRGSSDRVFGLVVGGVAAAVGLWKLDGGRPIPAAVLGVGGLLVLFGLTWPRALAPLNRGWMKLGTLLSKVMSPLVMGVLYFGLITPVAFLSRIFRGDAMRLRLDRRAATYWVPSAGARDARFMTRPF